MKTVENTRPEEDILDGLLQLERRRVFGTFDPDGIVSVPVSDEDRVWREHNTEMHPYREILVILKGEFQFRLASYVCEGRAGDVVLIDAFEEHDRFHPPSVRNCLTLWLYCCPQTILCIVNRTRDGGNKILMRFEFARPEFCMTLNTAWRDAVGGQRSAAAAKLEINGVVDVLRGAFAEKILASERSGVRRFSEVQNRQYLTVMAAMAYINDHLNENPQLDKLAKRSGYSAPHFARLFRQYSGYGFRDYIDFVRMGMYRKMYFAEHMHKKEIALELGFSSSSSLIHWLRGAAPRLTAYAPAAKPVANISQEQK